MATDMDVQESHHGPTLILALDDYERAARAGVCYGLPAFNPSILSP